MCMVVLRQCNDEQVISWKLCVGKTECVFSRNVCTVGVIVEDTFLDLCRHISHTVLCDMTRTPAAKTDAISALCVAPVEIIISRSRPSPSTSLTMCLVSV